MTWPKQIYAGRGVIEVDRMKSTTFDLNNITPASKMQLRTHFKRDGYLLLKSFLPTAEVQEVQEIIKQRLKESNLIENGQPELQIPEVFQAPSGNENCKVETTTNPGLLGQQDWIKSHPCMVKLLEHPNLYKLFEVLFDSEEITTIPYKWLRAVGSNLFTGLHRDSVYVGHISQDILTAWIPITSVPTTNGSLVVAPASHDSKRWKSVQSEYDSSCGRQGDGTSSGWLCLDPNDIIQKLDVQNPPIITKRKQKCSKVQKRTSSQSRPNNAKVISTPIWVSEDFGPGDVVILDLNVIHMTSTNVTEQWRISCDTRWLPI